MDHINEFPSSGSPMIFGLDSDEDLEIFVGSTNNLFVIDVKEAGAISDYFSYLTPRDFAQILPNGFLLDG